MKSKKLTILISILLVVTLVVVLASTVFTLKSVSFNFLNQKNILSNYDDGDYLDKIEVPYGDSIFFVDKNSLKDKLEKKNAYLEVINIETTFPNNLVVHVGEREEVFAIDYGNDTYAIVDKSLKILRFCDLAYLQRAGYLAPIVVKVNYTDVALDIKDYNICDFINVEHMSDVLLAVVNAFEVSGYNITSLKGFATEIILRENGSFIVDENGQYDLNFVKTVEITTKYGIKISINDAYSSLDTKVALGLKAYEMEHDKHNTSGEILVFEQEKRFVARYRSGD